MRYLEEEQLGVVAKRPVYLSDRGHSFLSRRQFAKVTPDMATPVFNTVIQQDCPHGRFCFSLLG